MEIFEHLGETIRRLRKEKKKTLSALGLEAKVGKGQLSRIENGRQEATLNTLAKILAALDRGKVLRPESLQAMWSPVKLSDGTEKGYGLGWTVEKYKDHKVVGHEGGSSAWVAHFPEEHLSIVVLCNLNNSKADEIHYGVADLYLGNR